LGRVAFGWPAGRIGRSAVLRNFEPDRETKFGEEAKLPHDAPLMLVSEISRDGRRDLNWPAPKIESNAKS
jgi:hypothetical protein